MVGRLVMIGPPPNLAHAGGTTRTGNSLNAGWRAEAILARRSLLPVPCVMAWLCGRIGDKT
jgi:hypothetical protein